MKMARFPDLSDEEGQEKDTEMPKQPKKLGKRKKKLRKSDAFTDSFETPKLTEDFDKM